MRGSAFLLRLLVPAASLLLLLGACEPGPGAAESPTGPGPEPAAEKQPNRTAPAAAVAPAFDGPPKTVLVELFSSQGCNSCPAADRVVAGFADHGWSADEVVPLTFHVTYWDDLGWMDPFASPIHDQRQIGYGRLPGSGRAGDETTINGPYTPQMVVDGRVHFSGSLGAVANAEIERARNAPTLVSLETSVTKTGTRVDVTVKSAASPDAELDTDRTKIGLFCALAQRELQTSVPRGENAGKTLTEYAVVRDLAGPQLFRAARENNTTFELTVPEGPPTGGSPSRAFDVVVFAQDLASLEILATQRVEIAGA